METFDGHVLTLRSGFASNGFLSKLRRLRSQDLFIDVLLVLPQTEIKAHKLILSCCSPYFEAMFGCDGFAEKDKQSVVIKGSILQKYPSNC